MMCPKERRNKILTINLIAKKKNCSWDMFRFYHEPFSINKTRLMQVFYDFHFNHCLVALFELLFFGADLYIAIVTCTDFDCTLRQGCCLAMWSASFIFSWYGVDAMSKTEKQSTPQAFLQLGCRCKCLKMAEFLSVSKCSFLRIYNDLVDSPM